MKILIITAKNSCIRNLSLKSLFKIIVNQNNFKKLNIIQIIKFIKTGVSFLVINICVHSL